jgi:Protein of unknown function (DUF2997)
MAEQELEITISPEGKVTVHTHGIKGEACMQYADLLVQIVGREEQREKTAEYYQVEQEIEITRIQQRR